MIIKKRFFIISFLLMSISTYSCAAAWSYKAAITAKELLVLMSACDLMPAASSYGYPQATLMEMCAQGKRLLKAGMSASGPGAWSWQPGKMRDHTDFKYAGNPKIEKNLKEKKVASISLDSAHFYSKWPLFFLSAKNASDGEEKVYFQNAINGLVANLFENVVTISETECVVRYRNYTDGTNGVYRWNYENKGVNTGHSEYALSYTPFFSGLALLDNKLIAEHYQKISSCYPYSVEERKKYFWSRGLEEERLLIMLSENQPSLMNGISPNQKQQDYYRRYFAKRISAKQNITTQDAYAAVVGDRMPVMHYAFFMGYEPWIADFNDYADKASQLICVNCKNAFNAYNEMHLIYFLAKYVNLANELNNVDRDKLKFVFDRVVKKVDSLYLVNSISPVSNPGWDGVLMFNFKKYVEWKLAYYNK